MTIKKAKELLSNAKVGNGPSKVNPVFTKKQALETIRNGVASYEKDNGEDFVLPDIMEKRVHQVIRNQRRPRY